MPHSTPTITLSVDDTLRASGLGRTTLYGLLAAGEIRAVKAGRRTLVDMESLRTYLARLPAITYRTKEAA